MVTLSLSLAIVLNAAASPAARVAYMHVKPSGVVENAVANDNRHSSGVLKNGVLTLTLEVRRGRWFPEADDGASEEVLTFAAQGGAPSIPGPLLRVPAGTVVHLTLRNTERVAVSIHGLGSQATADSGAINLPAGAERDVRFTLKKPGTYYYWGTTDGAPLADRSALASQLYGAIVVDSASVSRGIPKDRVFVIGVWGVPPDSSGPKPWVPRDMMVINGKSWPHTERFDFAVGDTVRWRWVNPTGDAHPMHLHGFFFTVNSRGGASVDTVYSAADRRLAVTELMMPGGTMTMQWVATTVGNWLFHCHFAFHVSPYLSFSKIPDMEDPASPMAAVHDASAMRGLVLGIRVHSNGTAMATTSTVPPHNYRLLVQSAAARYGKLPGYGYVLAADNASISRDSVPVMSSLLLMRRGEPVRITVVNNLPAPTAVHWHGMEIQDSYVDGVPGWSGTDGHVASAIAPGDSFVASFTPKRAGTFIYHAHSHEEFQIASGLYGPLIVIDPDSTYAPERDLSFVIGANGLDLTRGRINGQLDPAPMQLTVGTTYRMRIIQINPEYRLSVSLDADGVTLPWRAIAKDGADLPPNQRVTKSAPIGMGPGETADFEFTPTKPGVMNLLVKTQLDGWKVRVPLNIIVPARQ